MTPYQLKEQRRRIRLSIAGAILLHLLFIGGFLLYDLLFVKDLSEISGPVLVKLGEPEGENVPSLPDKAVPQPPEPSKNIPEVADSPLPQREPLPEDPRLQEGKTPAASKPSPKPEPAAKAETAPQSESPSEPAEPRKSEPVRTPEIPPSDSQPEKALPPRPVVVKGEEAGNSWEYQFAAEQGAVSRSLYAEIYLYMPLPKVIPGSLYSRMTGESYRLGISKQALLRQYYREVNGDWFYEKKPYMDDVRALWAYLIDEGYDQNKADYKAGRNLRPVVIEFTLSAEAELLDAAIKASSGDGQVDDAVLEGFQMASFSNASGRKIKGRFTYRFD